MKNDLYNEVREAVSECFASDPELIEKWHIEAGKGLEKCIARTMSDVEHQFHPSFKFHKIYSEKELAAYWGTEHGNYVNLIFVKPHFRNHSFMMHFWDAVQASVGDLFHTAIYAKNGPARSFYNKHGIEIDEFKMDGNTVVVFEFKKVAV